jgi:CDP-diacylglycerol---glycerol-3-phosphate 3-phosphatidyltransferase
MQWNTPNLLTLLRIVLIPLFVFVYYLPSPWGYMIATWLFVLAGITDWLDGYFARRLQQFSPFGAFLDPVADKLMVVAALVVLLANPTVLGRVLDVRLFAFVVLVIVGREIAVSALREWMAEIGKRSHVAVSFVGKVKTAAQMVAIPFMIWREPIWGLPIFRIGEVLFYVAAALTLWSMVVYVRAAWPSLMGSGPVPKPKV